MNTFYEDILLREEFHLEQKLQKDAEFTKYVTVRYEDRITGEIRHVISTPTADRYPPEIYIVDYRMPVYVGVGQLRNDYYGTAKIILSEPVLQNRIHNPQKNCRLLRIIIKIKYSSNNYVRNKKMPDL
jgi:hypothetical protein